MKIKKVEDFHAKNAQEMSMADLEEMRAQTLMTAMLTDTLIIPDEGEGGTEPGGIDGFDIYEED